MLAEDLGDGALDDGVPPSEESPVGGRIRELRRTRGLTLVALAERCELSSSFLSQIETGWARPSMNSLERIARALGSSPVELMAPSRPADRNVPAIEATSSSAATWGGFGEGRARMLVDTGRPFQPLEYAANNTDPGEFHRHDEDEFLFVLSGTVIVDLESDLRTLGASDSLYYAGGTPHRWSSPDGSEYRLLVVKQRPSGNWTHHPHGSLTGR